MLVNIKLHNKFRKWCQFPHSSYFINYIYFICKSYSVPLRNFILGKLQKEKKNDCSSGSQGDFISVPVFGQQDIEIEIIYN